MQEIEELQEALEEPNGVVAEAITAQRKDEARVRELEALLKCDGCGKPFDEDGGCCPTCFSEGIAAHVKPLKAELAAKEAATIKRCAALLDKRNYRELRSRGGMGQILAATQDQEAKDCAAAVRALKEPAQELSSPRS